MGSTMQPKDQPHEESADSRRRAGGWPVPPWHSSSFPRRRAVARPTARRRSGRSSPSARRAISSGSSRRSGRWRGARPDRAGSRWRPARWRRRRWLRGGAGGAGAAARRRPASPPGRSTIAPGGTPTSAPAPSSPWSGWCCNTPELLPPALLARLRAAVSNAAPASGGGADAESLVVRRHREPADDRHWPAAWSGRSWRGRRTPPRRAAGGPSPRRSSSRARARRLVRGGEPGVPRAVDHRPAAARGLRAAAGGARAGARAARRAVRRLGAGAGGGLSGGRRRVRTSSVWSLSRQSSPWQSWAWLTAGIGDPTEINFMDRVELPVSRYRMPEEAVRLLDRPPPAAPLRDPRAAEDHALQAAPLQRRALRLRHAGLHPGRLADGGGAGLRVSGGQEIVATLYAESPPSPRSISGAARGRRRATTRRSSTRSTRRWRSKNVVLARLDTPGAGIGHAFLAPRLVGARAAGRTSLVSRCGDAYVALVTQGGWELAPAIDKYPGLLRRREQAGGAISPAPGWRCRAASRRAWPWWPGRRAEDGDFAAWKKRQAGGPRSRWAEDGEIHFTAATARAPTSSPAARPRFARQVRRGGGLSAAGRAVPRPRRRQGSGPIVRGLPER